MVYFCCNRMIVNFLSLIFTFCCTILFLYKSYECLDQFLDYEIVTRNSEENQEDYPLPQICINQDWISDEKLASLNISYREYTKQGKWRNYNSTKDEEIIYDELSSSFENLVEKVVLSKMISPTNDDYEKVTFKAEDNKGMILKRCDYYDKLKCFCIKFSSEMVAFGVQAISIYPKIGSVVTVAAPGSFYSHSRKKSMIRLPTGYKYLYNIDYKITRSQPLVDDPCYPMMDWGEDDCKLKFINDLLMKKFGCTAPWILHFAR